MEKPLLDLSQHDHTDFYTFVGRVSLLLVATNVDAITATMFLREIVAAGSHDLSREQMLDIAQHYVHIEA